MSSDRTEKATPKRRETAQRKGQIARRPEVGVAAGFLAALVMIRATGADLLHQASNLFTKSLLLPSTVTESLTSPAVYGMFIDAVLILAVLSLPVVMAALIAVLVSNFAQGGLTLASEALTPRADKFSPASNFKKIFSGNNVVELLKGVLKLGAITFICAGPLMTAVREAPALIGAPASYAFRAVGGLAYDLGLRAGGALICMLAIDYGYGWYKHEKSLRMTKQEVRDEYKQQEGDPFMKSQRRQKARALAQQRIGVEVPRADVVVTNPTHFAVALRYNHECDRAPVVVAKGADHLATRIREIARAHDVMVVENPPLARTLYRTIEPGRAIPAELFRVVAELLAYVYQQRARAANPQANTRAH